jgi:transcriptional regulator with XRE-family HTH domain
MPERDDPGTIGCRVQQLRVERRLTQRQLAETAEEHHVRALSLLERAGAAGDLADLCRLLGDLLRRTGRVEAALDAYRTGLGHRTAPGTTTLGPAPAQPPL